MLQPDESSNHGDKPLPSPVRLLRFLRVPVERTEWPSLMWASLMFFCLLASYYCIRPMRDVTDVGYNNLKWAYSITAGVILVLTPIYGWAVSKWPRQKFVPPIYAAIAGLMLVFFYLLGYSPWNQTLWLKWTFFCWASIINVFIMSVYWDVIVDIFNPQQGTRLFGFIILFSQLGALFGSQVASALARQGHFTLITSIVFLLGALLCYRYLERAAKTMDATAIDCANQPPGEGTWSQIRRIVKSPFLIGILVCALLYTLASTFLYQEHRDFLLKFFADKADRLKWQAEVNSWTSILTFILLGITYLTKQLSVRIGLFALPVLMYIGFWILWGMSPELAIGYTLAALLTISRVLEFSLNKSARKVLFTVLSRDEKYSAQSFIDTFIHRFGDVLSIFTISFLSQFLRFRGLTFVIGQLGLIVIVVSIYIYRVYKRKQATLAGESPSTLSLSENGSHND